MIVFFTFIFEHSGVRAGVISPVQEHFAQVRIAPVKIDHAGVRGVRAPLRPPLRTPDVTPAGMVH